MRISFNPKALCAAAVISMALPFSAQGEGHDGQYVGSKGYVGEKGYVAETAARPVRQSQNKSNGSQPKRVYYGERWTVPGCPAGFNGMYRGNLYCVNGRPID